MNSSPASPASAVSPPVARYGATVGRRLHARRSLADVTLDGTRASWHAATRWIVCALAALAALMVLVEPHRVCNAWGSCDAGDWGPRHTLFDDEGAMPVVLLVMVIALQLGGLRRTLAPRVLTAIGAWIAAVVVLGQAALVHLLSTVEGADGAVFAVFVTALVCLAQIVIEPVLAVRQRRVLEAREPHFARAAVVSR